MIAVRYFIFHIELKIIYSTYQINDVKNIILLQPGLKWEANAMVSSDGEVVPYERPVYLDGPVEVN